MSEDVAQIYNQSHACSLLKPTRYRTTTLRRHSSLVFLHESQRVSFLLLLVTDGQQAPHNYEVQGMKTTPRMKTKQSSGRINAKVQVFPSHYSLNRQVPALSCKGENNDRQHPACRGGKSRRGHSRGGSNHGFTKGSNSKYSWTAYYLHLKLSTAHGAVQAKAGTERPGLWANCANDLGWVAPLRSAISFLWEMKPPVALSQEKMTQRL